MSKNTAAPRAEPPRARRPAASGKTSQERKSRSVRPSTRSPAPSRPRRATPGENFAARQTAHQLSHRIRAGLVRGELRASADGPCTDRPHRTHAGPFQGKLLRLIRTVRPSAQPHRARAELLRGKLHKDESYCPTDGTTACRANRPRCIRAELRRGKLRGPSDCLCTNRPHRTRAGPFQGKFHRHVRRPARQSNPTASAQGHSGKNFISPKTTAQQTASRPRPIRRHNARRPVQPFWSNFAARWTAQRSFIRPSAPAKLLTHESARPTLARPNRNAPHAAPSDSATMSSA